MSVAAPDGEIRDSEGSAFTQGRSVNMNRSSADITNLSRNNKPPRCKAGQVPIVVEEDDDKTPIEVWLLAAVFIASWIFGLIAWFRL